MDHRILRLDMICISSQLISIGENLLSILMRVLIEEPYVSELRTQCSGLRTPDSESRSLGSESRTLMNVFHWEPSLWLRTLSIETLAALLD